jgi:hypothetical protein
MHFNRVLLAFSAIGSALSLPQLVSDANLFPLAIRDNPDVCVDDFTAKDRYDCPKPAGHVLQDNGQRCGTKDMLTASNRCKVCKYLPY